MLPPPGGQADSAMIGFAAVDADGIATTTGGDGGEMVSVSSYAELEQYASSAEPYIIQVNGTIHGNGDKMMRVNSNTTIIGVGANATIDGFGFDINGYYGSSSEPACDENQIGTFTPVSNVIIRNLSFKNSPDDSINAQCLSHHLWIDHNTFYKSNDGSVDIKRGSDWATVSWNHFIETNKTMLLGHDDSAEWLDEGRLHVTYHHNYFENTVTRHPRVRFGEAHVFNNYLYNENVKPDYFVSVDMGASVYMEGNLSEVAKYTGFELVLDEGATSATSVTYASDNEVIFLAETFEPEIQVNNGARFNPGDFYSYSDQYDNAAALKSIVPANAGVGKID